MAAKKKPAPKKPEADQGDRTNRAHTTTAPDWAGAFLRALASSGVILDAAKAAGVARSTVYERRDSDPPFRAAMVAALEDATDMLEREARRRALEGTLRPVFGSGGQGAGTVQVGEVREYSDTLMCLLLKAHRPERFRENHHHTGEMRHTHAAEGMSDDQLAAIAARGA